MRVVRILSVAVAGTLLLASVALAQRPGGGRFGRFGGRLASPVMLALNPDVQTELKVDATQRDLIAALGEAYRQEARQTFQGLRDLSEQERATRLQQFNANYEKKLSEILKPEQLKRLKQIALQQQGARGLLQPEVASALNLSQEQRTKIQAVLDQSAQARQSLFQGGQVDRETIGQKLRELRQQEEQQVQAILTETQKTKLKELLGPPFELRFRRPGGGQNG